MSPLSLSGCLVDTPVALRLRASVKFWRETLTAPPSVLRVIVEGYKLPFVSEPVSFFARNSVGALKHSGFVATEIARLVETGVLRRVAEQPAGVCALSVDESRTKLRLIMNAIPLNRFLLAPRFKFESVRTACELIAPGDMTVQFDFKAAYHHVRVWPGHVGWLGISWAGVFYVFLALPFGLNSAPYAFTKITRPIVRFFRAQGFRMVLMLDDGLVALAPGQAEQAETVHRSLLASGFLLAEEKCRWVPSPRTEGFLGYTLDVTRNELGITAQRQAKLVAALSALDLSRSIPRRVVASVTGRVVSMSLVIGPLARLMTRGLYAMQGGEAFGWDDVAEWTPAAIREVAFWRQFAADQRLRGCTTIWGGQRPADATVSTDASEDGVGAAFGALRLAIPLPRAAIGTSSTHRELLAVSLTLQAWREPLRALRVQWRTDNQAVVAILANGSRADDCQAVAAEIFAMAEANGTKILPVWVPRELNTVADALSKAADIDDDELTHHAFVAVCGLFGLKPAIDLFASHVSTKCESFASRSYSPHAIVFDAFSAAWAPFGPLYIFPPVALIARVLNRLTQEQDVDHPAGVAIPAMVAILVPGRRPHARGGPQRYAAVTEQFRLR